MGYTYREWNGTLQTFTSGLRATALDQMRVKSASKGHLGDQSCHSNVLPLAALFNFGEILPYALFFQKDMSFFPPPDLALGLVFLE